MNFSRAILRLTIFALLVTTAACEQNGGGMYAENAEEMDGMAMGEGYVPDSLSRAKLAPLVKAYHEGEEIFFIHTEASDRQVAGMLTEMMGPEVVVVPELAQVPGAALAEMYVFKSGVEGMGPFGYQPDVFGSVPGGEEYSPLRVIQQVNWNEEATPRELRSVGAIREAERQGEITIEDTGVVVNAPVLAGPKGHRGTMAGM